ncbi:Leucine Rich Repeat family protein [Trichomonas vaginalis G3]|uniref:Leucine Rich Repeat family protein n=1 Tax=Trichomonas vaginalis (strain ATCC PRA-98 / G3) TaxID=412133 RepID=A2DD96_TRIV3|nr:uncharacterized protein TVAGG3_0987050 [Trichomonas vaginalis G3]EAY21575.1 Leucine Rich Repeat family protein [Trichomonas vaginalis G3]KAI5489751.1 leucine-rich repeat, isoform f-related family [Trichomonas vaginalis G3]|eukprot:XP_001582561.1 hypothetical protein [Trichomonas vaginalis G3]
MLQPVIQIINNEQVKNILLVTEFTLYILSQNEETQKISIISSHPLITLKSGSRPTETTIVLNFSKETLTFLCDKNDFILETIEIDLRWLLIPRELPHLKTKLGPDSPSKDKYLNLVDRYRARMFWRGRPASKAEIEVLRKYSSNKPKELRISFITDNGLSLSSILLSIEIEVGIDTLIIDNVLDQSKWEIVSQFLSKNSTIQTIIFQADIGDDTFQSLISSVLANKRLYIKNIILISITITTSMLQSLSMYLSGKTLDSISIIKCRFVKDFAEFIETISEHGRNITKVKLQSINLQNRNLFIGSFTQVTQFYLKRCGIEISSFIQTLSLFSRTHIEYVDLSYNNAMETISDRCILPFSISTIVAENVDWKNNNLFNMLKIATQAPSKISLHVGDAELTENDWNELFSNLSQLNPSRLVCLNWRNNPIQQPFADFIERMPSLAFLSIAGCPNIQQTNLIDVICQHPLIQLLDIHGTNQMKLGPTSGQILLKLKNAKALRRFDISNNYLGSPLLSNVLKIFGTIKNLRCILLDKNDQKDISSYEDIINFLNSRKEVVIQYPSNDIKTLMDLNLLTESKLNKTRSFFKKSSSMGNRCPYASDWERMIEGNYVENEVVEEFIEDPTSSDSENGNPSEEASSQPDTDTEPPPSAHSSYANRWSMDFIELPHNNNDEIMKILSDRYNIDYLCQTLNYA